MLDKLDLTIISVALWVHNTTGNTPLKVNLHQQMRIKFFCEMQFINYPLDVQVQYVLGSLQNEKKWPNFFNLKSYRNVTFGWAVTFTDQIF